MQTKQVYQLLCVETRSFALFIYDAPRRQLASLLQRMESSLLGSISPISAGVMTI